LWQGVLGFATKTKRSAGVFPLAGNCCDGAIQKGGGMGTNMMTIILELQEALKYAIIEIYRPIALKEPGHEHGDFLTAFAQAVVGSDFENFEPLRQPALHFIAKYELWKEGQK
jgi:hypothetical protein